MTNESDNNPLLGKMDALIKKHRGPAAEPTQSSPPAGWLPVLTEVLVRGTPPSSTPISATAMNTAEPTRPASAPRAPAANDPEALANQLLSELGPKLSAVMEQQVATELRKNLDETVALLLSQLDVSVRDIVRDAVAQKLKETKPDN